MRKYLDRVRGERGSVGVLVALVIFTVIGSLMMTWNTAQLSKEKMRMQNAADAAALGYCTWQARGMNAIQNINDEMYMSLDFCKTLQTVAKVMCGVAAAFEAAGKGFPPLRFLAVPFHILGVMTGGTSGWLSTKVCKYILSPAGYFYAYASVPFGYLNAMQLSEENTADPIGNLSLNLGDFGNLGIYALGISIPLVDTVKLPVEKKDTTDSPWKHDEATALKEIIGNPVSCPAPWSTIHKLCGTGEAWEYTPWQSSRDRSSKVPSAVDPDSSHELGRTPGPVVFGVNKYCTHIPLLDITAWLGDSSTNYGNIRRMPIVAIAAAQCIAGDIIPNSKRKKPTSGVNQRMAGFGVGATAKLIPVSEALKWLKPAVGKAVGAVVYH